MFALWPRALCAAIALVLSAYPVLGQSGSAMMKPNGPVTLNGTTTSEPSAISPGDKLTTGDKSGAAISNKGSIIGLSARAAVTYRGKLVEIGSGIVTVSTTSGFSALVNGYSAAPTSLSAKYQIVDNGYCASLTVEQGTVIASKGTLRNVVTEGKSIALDESMCDKAARVVSPVSGFGAGPLAAGVVVGGVSTVIMLEKTSGSPSAP